MGNRLDRDIGEAGSPEVRENPRFCGVRAMNCGGSFGNTCCSAWCTTLAKSFSSILSHTLKNSRPPGRSTRRASAYPLTRSGKNITPN
jgi:hypothetical protein